jgi:protoporphyrinogen oxidase
MDVVVGAGVAGLGASLALRELSKNAGTQFRHLESRSTPFGHCRSFKIPGYPQFVFDEGPHVSFTKDAYAKRVFHESAGGVNGIVPQIENFAQGVWIPHPVQNHLAYLPDSIRTQILEEIQEEATPAAEPKNYEEWLYSAFGKSFSHAYPFRYTRKYWTVEPKAMTTDWIAARIHPATKEEMVMGASEKQSRTKDVHYISRFYYPSEGGFESFFKAFLHDKIEYSQTLTSVSLASQEIQLASGQTQKFSNLFTSIPLDRLLGLISPQTPELREIADGLLCTSLEIFSIIFKPRADSFTSHWGYVYDEDIPFARFYFPHLLQQVDTELRAIQVEIYSSKLMPAGARETSINKVVDGLSRMGILNASDVVKYDSRKCSHANVVFTENRAALVDRALIILNRHSIYPIGRFGKWAYLWSDDSFLDGIKTVNTVYNASSASFEL